MAAVFLSLVDVRSVFRPIFSLNICDCVVMAALIKNAATLLVPIICLMSTGVADPNPRVVQWNKDVAFGPDGPWHAVTVGVGTDAAGNPLSQVNLLPGAMGESIVFNTGYCSESGSSCPARKAGFWDVYNSRTAIENVRKDPATVWQWGSSCAINQSGAALESVDQMSINTSQGLVAVNNTILASTSADDVHSPDGSTWAQTIGSLSLGIHGGTLTFPNLTGNTIPGYLASQDEIPSNSVGLHYGSANLGIEGSLVYGGYDQSRVIGDVGVFQLNQPGDIPTPNLVDVQIGVESGDSPFANGTNKFIGLLEVNQSKPDGQPTIINPLLSYYFASNKTCDNIAKQLPVTLQPSLGLYTWNTGDPMFKSIVQSPAYLAFVFASGFPVSSGNLTIKVPLSLLNLTLEPPIVTAPLQYFPCQPFTASDGSGNNFLGRAFLQAAFFAINWEQSIYYIAQAPGPSPDAPNIQSLGPNDMTLQSDPAYKFADSWSKTWTPFENHQSASNTPQVQPSPSDASSDNRSGGNDLSKGVVAGISTGAAIGAIAIAAAAWLLWRRWRKARKTRAEQENDSRTLKPDGLNSLHEKEAGIPLPNEVIGDQRYVHEVPVGSPRFEVEGDRPPVPDKDAFTLPVHMRQEM